MAVNNIGAVDTATTTVDTDSTDNINTQAKTFDQNEVNAIIARTKSQMEKKFAIKYEGLDDTDNIRDIIAQHTKRETTKSIDKGEFEKVLNAVNTKNALELQRRDSIIEGYRLDTPIISAAAKFRAIDPEQVKSLIRNNIRLNAEGEVEVLGADGKASYDDKGRLVSVEDYVSSWLLKNPHHVSATPSTTNSRTNIAGGSNVKFDVSKLDMNNPADRKQYAEHRKTLGIH